VIVAVRPVPLERWSSGTAIGALTISSLVTVVGRTSRSTPSGSWPAARPVALQGGLGRDRQFGPDALPGDSGSPSSFYSLADLALAASAGQGRLPQQMLNHRDLVVG